VQQQQTAADIFNVETNVIYAQLFAQKLRRTNWRQPATGHNTRANMQDERWCKNRRQIIQKYSTQATFT